MQRWTEEFVGHAHKKCVQINRNGVFDQGKVLYMEPDWDCLDLLNAASQRMDMVPAAKRIFNADGTEIDDCMMIVDDDILFFSKNEDFISPESLHADGPDQSGRSETERLPHSLGGYKVGELLGKGGFGEVRLGDHSLTGEKVALKFLRKAEIHSLGAAERTNTEIQCLATLKHMNIIKMVHHLESVNHVVLIFELMEGGDLLRFLLRRGGMSPTSSSASHKMATPSILEDSSFPQSRCTLSEDEARHTFYQVVSAISYAHNQHICHRDLKLENILLKDNSLSIVKIADFGLSDFYRPGATMKSTCGTLSFLAPEVFKGTSNAGPPLDVWSLGVILFAMLCGRLPFEGPDLVGTKRPREQIIKSRITKCQYKIDDHLGPEVKDLVRRMLLVDPGERASLPEIFNHVWMRAAVGGCLPEPAPQPAMLLSPNANISSKLFPSTPESGFILPAIASPVVGINQKSIKVPENGLIFVDEDFVPPLEREDSLPNGHSSKGGRHRTSLSMSGLNTLSQGRPSSTSISSGKSQMSSSVDLLALEGLTVASEAPAQLVPGSPPLSARRHSIARLMFSPSKGDLSADRQPSNSSIDLSSADLMTPRSSGSAVSPSPYSQVDESTPSQTVNKAFKLVPLRRQITVESRNSDPSGEFSSPSAKARSYSTSDASTTGTSIPGARPITGRRAGAVYGDYDDDDDSLSTSNWRNITLDPSPSSNNLTANPATTAAAAAPSSRKFSASVASSKGRREHLSQNRTASSSSLTASSTPSASSASLTKDRTPPPSTLNGRSVSSNLATAAAALTTISPSPRDELGPTLGNISKPLSQRDLTAHGYATHSGIAAFVQLNVESNNRR